MQQITDEQIKEFAKTSSLEIYKKDHVIVDINFHIAFIAGFKKAQELLQVKGTKPLSEITELELSELAEISNITIGNHFSDDFESIKSFKKHITGIKSFRGQLSSMPHDICWPVDFFDYLRSKGYILPTQKA